MCRHRPVLTVQLHQIPPISKRRQGLYKHCPPRHGHHAIRIHILPLSPRWFSESHTAKNTFLRVVCGWLSESRVGDVIGEKQIWEKFNHRAASPILLPVTSSPKLWRLESLDADGPADELNPRTSLLPQQPKLYSLRQPHMNNRSAQVGRLLFHIDENCSGWERGGGGHETMAGCHCPGQEPRPSPPFCLLRSGSHSPTGPFGGLPSLWWRDFYHAFGFSLNQLHLPGYLTPTVSVSERVMRHGRGNWGVSRWPMTGGGILCFGSSQVEAAKTHLKIRTLWLQIQEQQQRSLRSLIWSAEVDLVERKQSKGASGDSLSSDIQSMLLKLRLNRYLFLLRRVPFARYLMRMKAPEPSCTVQSHFQKRAFCMFTDVRSVT